MPYHFAVPPSYATVDAVPSVDGSVLCSSASLDGFDRTAIALLRPVSASENASSFVLLRDADRAFEEVYATIVVPAIVSTASMPIDITSAEPVCCLSLEIIRRGATAVQSP